MNFRRVIGLAAIALSIGLWMACGQVYRPVVIPTTTTPPNPANFHSVFAVNDNVPFNPGTAMEIDVRGDSIIAETGGPGSTVGHIGMHPTHAMILPNLSRVFVANAGSLDTIVTANGTERGTDVVTSFTPEITSSAFGFTGLTTFTLPNVVGESFTISAISEVGNTVTVTLSSSAVVNAGAIIVVSGVPISGYNGTFTVIPGGSGNTVTYIDPISGLAALTAPPAIGTVSISPIFCSYLPDFVTAAQNNSVYVANYGVETDPLCNLSGTDSIAVLSNALNSITNIVNLPPGSHPVALAEVQSPVGDKLYVANEGSNLVPGGNLTSFNTVDMTVNSVIVLSGTSTPVWVVGRVDGKRVYVLTQGDVVSQVAGQLVTIDTATDSEVNSFPVGVGANFMDYDPRLNRLYVTNPGTSSNPASAAVYVFSATGGPNDTPSMLTSQPISFASGSVPCPTGCSPVSVAALPDSSRFYVASYETAAACPGSHVGGACMVPQLTVIDARNFAIRVSTMSLLTSPPFASGQSAVPVVSTCIPTIPYTLTPGIPATARFRMFATAAADSSRVHVSICDAGVVAVVNTTTNTITQGGSNKPDTLLTDLPAPFSAGTPASNGEPPPQNPIFLLTGQ